MASITLKDIPEQIHAQLTREAAAHHRSLNGEVLRRVELSFELESAFNSKRDAQWIQDALDSGPEKPLTRQDFDAAVKRGLAGAARAKAAP
jgi:plasmid stability protein